MLSPMKNTIWTLTLLALAATSCSQLGDSQAMAKPAVAWDLPAAEVYYVDSARSEAQTSVEILKQGKGEQVLNGDLVSVHYQGWVQDTAEVFDSSYDRDEPIVFDAGGNRVIEGWSVTVPGMAVGTMARLVIPPKMGYGERGAGGVIPPNATLVFEIEVMSTTR
jgi:FKBP-type peptidyl-prolyl cis-trans isomerase